MALPTNLLSKYFLKRNVRDRIMNKINEIQASCSWLDVDLLIDKDGVDLADMTHDEIVQQTNEYRHIAQLCVDLWRNYDYYGQFRFKSQYDSKSYRELLEGIGCVCIDEWWSCPKRPSEDIVQVNVFTFCVYLSQSTELSKNKSNDITRLSCLCDGVMEHGNNSCDVCSDVSPETNMHSNMIEERKNESLLQSRKNSDISDQDGISRDNITANSGDSFCTLMSLTETIGSESEVAELRNINRVRYLDICNDVSDGKYSCGTSGIIVGSDAGDNSGSMMDLSMDTDVTLTCDNNTANIRGDPQKEPSTSILGDLWECNSCNLLYVYDHSVCDACLGSMKDVGRWICKSCKVSNTFLDWRCDVCLSPNNNILVKYCLICKITEIDGFDTVCGECVIENNSLLTKSQWQCQFKQCGVWSEEDRMFCKKCGLWRYSFDSYTAGDAVRRFRNGKETSVWICSSCNRFNSIESLKCGGWICWTKRFQN